MYNSRKIHHAHHQPAQSRRFYHAGRAPAILELLQLRAGATVGVSVDAGRLVVEPNPKPHYTLEELLEGSDYSEPRSAEDQEWLDSPPVGRELL